MPTLGDLQGVEPIAGDFDARALDGVHRACLLTPSTERAEARQIGFVEAAKEAG